MPKDKKITAWQAYDREPDGEVVKRGTAFVTQMTGNPYYLHPPISLAVLQAAIDRLLELMAQALDGSRKVVAEKNKQRGEVIRQIRLLTRYVEVTCNNDEAIFKSSGLELVYTTRRRTEHWSEFIRRIEYGDISGKLLVFVNADPEASSYQLRYAIFLNGAPNGEWTTSSFTKVKSAQVLDGLIPGTTYAFQVRTLRDKQYTDWSDSVTFMSK